MISDDFQIGPNGAYEHVGNELDLQYQDLLQHILDNGVEKETRNGKVLSVFGRTIRFKFNGNNFPLLTTKKMAWKTMVTELLWFLRGDTSIEYLLKNDCNIWTGDSYKYYEKWWKSYSPGGAPIPLSKEKFINKIKTDESFAKRFGELGPVYGKQWRSWDVPKILTIEKGKIENGIGTEWGSWERNPIDQIANLINDLKTNPDSRRLMVNAWNVGELDQMVLPPCHYGFQVYTRELSDEERLNWMKNNKSNVVLPTRDPNVEFSIDEFFKPYGVPKRAISLMWNQRSVDTFLGLPFNIASYGLLLCILAEMTNMVPEDLIGNLGDVHLYKNHTIQAIEQISRKPYSLPNLRIDTEFWNPENILGDDYGAIIEGLELRDFQIENYQSHSAIKAPLSN